MKDMLDTKRKKTVDDYMKLPDDVRVELFEGEYFMSPSPNPRHQTVVVNLCERLSGYVRSNKLGRVFVAPFDCIFSDEDIAQPDILFIATENLGKIRDRLYGAPDLAIEVLSPTHAERDRIVKRDLCAKYGVRECWIVDCEARTIEIMVLEGGRFRLWGILGGSDRLTSPLLGEVDVSVAELFD